MSASHTTYPHLPPAWRDAVMLELRMRGASGATIGDVLAVAETHCADSGETPDSAFGRAREYAAEVPLGDGAHPNTLPDLIRSAAPTMVSLAGMMLAFATTTAWVSHRPTVVTWGLVLGVVAILAGSVALVQWIHVFASRMWALAVLVWLMTAGFTTLVVGLARQAFALPAPLAAGAAVILLAAGAWWSQLGPEADPVADPLRGDPAPRATRLVGAIGPWLFPVATGVGVLLLLMVGG